MPSESDAIAASLEPATVDSLARDLRALGLEPGSVVIVHSSLSALGWVAGGPQAVVEGLRAAVGAAGTIVMPTQSSQLSDPAAWENPPVPPHWVERVRAGLPAYDPYLTPTTAMGQVVDCFRQHRDTRRSSHPLDSFAALGPLAEAIVDPHPLSPGLGETSPLGRLYQFDAQILLLGVGHGNDTSLHLAEHRARWPGKRDGVQGAPILVDGERRWVTYHDLDLDTDDFDRIGDVVAASGLERLGPVGAGVGRLSSMAAVVDLAVGWMTANRGHTAG